MVNRWQEEDQAVQLRARDRNEWIESMTDAWGSARRTPALYACECDVNDCHSIVSMTRAEYEGVRFRGTRFVIAVNHENPEFDHVVVETEGFAVIEKLPGDASRAAQARDPRRNRLNPQSSLPNEDEP